METLKHKSYIGVILSLEETILTIDEIDNQLVNHCTKLGNKAKIDAPVKKQVESGEFSYAGWIAGFVGGAIVACIKIISSVSNRNSGGFFSGLFSTMGAFLSGLFIGSIVGAIFGLVVNAIAKNKLKQDAQKEADLKYYSKLDEYHLAQEKDQHRVELENKQKSYIYRQIELLRSKRANTIKVVDEIYRYNIIDSKYWHDISALSYFSQYYIKELNVSSVKEAIEAYERAYADYENDKQHRLVVTSPQDIVYASDYSIRKQRDLFKIMKGVHSSATPVVNETIEESEIQNKAEKDTAICRFIDEKNEAEKIYATIIASVFK